MYKNSITFFFLKSRLLSNLIEIEIKLDYEHTVGHNIYMHIYFIKQLGLKKTKKNKNLKLISKSYAMAIPSCYSIWINKA